MNYEKINKYRCTDGEVFDTKKDAQNHCDCDDLEQEFIRTILNTFIDFDEFMEEYKITDLKNAISVLNKVIEFKAQ